MSERTVREAVQETMTANPDLTTLEAVKIVIPEEIQAAINDVSETAELTEKAYSMTLAEFQALKVVDRDTVLFALLREQCASMQALETRIDGWEQKVRDMMSPEGVEEMKKKVMDAIGGGNLLGGMFGL